MADAPNAETILRTLRLDETCRDVVDFGCGYGTFAIPAARIVSGTVPALDVDPDMVQATQAKADADGLSNVRACWRQVDSDDVRRALRRETVLVSVVHANSEVGTLQSMAEMAQIAKAHGVRAGRLGRDQPPERQRFKQPARVADGRAVVTALH